MVPGPPAACKMPKSRHAQIPYVNGRMVSVGSALALPLNQQLNAQNPHACPLTITPVLCHLHECIRASTHTHTHTIKMVTSLHIIYIHPPTYFKPSPHDSYHLVQCQCYGNSYTVLPRRNRQENVCMCLVQVFSILNCWESGGTGAHSLLRFLS